VRVAPSGSDTTGGGLVPFRTVQKAIDVAKGDPMLPRRVCVAHGTICASSAVYPYDVQMADGISVYGNYESTTWTRCSGATMTLLRPPSAQGVRFDSSISQPTVLDGFRIDRASAATTAAVTLDGARNVILSDLTITNNVTAQVSYGVDLRSGAEALITRSLVTAGTGTVRSAGVHSLAATPTIRDNCPHINGFGRCDMWCDPRGIRGQQMAGAAETYAVLLEDSPGAMIETSALCWNRAASGAVVRVVGDGSGIVVRASRIDSEGGQTDSHGIWLEDCGGASPWIVDNDRVWANGALTTTRAHAVHAVGDCHPVIDSNVSLSGAPEGSTSGTIGVYCGAAGGRALGAFSGRLTWK